MRNEVLVKRNELHKIYQSLQDMIEILQPMLAEVGCIHLDAQSVTTMADVSVGIRKYYCPDCGETIEEEIGK